MIVGGALVKFGTQQTNYFGNSMMVTEAAVFVFHASIGAPIDRVVCLCGDLKLNTTKTPKG